MNHYIIIFKYMGVCVCVYLYVIMYTNSLANYVNIPHIFNIYL